MNIDTDRLYYKFSDYLKQRFGEKVFKVSVNAGFSCPNRDGSKGVDGCIFCDNRAFSYNTRTPGNTIDLQIRNGIKSVRSRYNANKYIIYFQSNTNTYAPLEVLKEKYDIIKEFNNVVGLSVGTRPDCIDDDVLDLLEEYTENYEVWIELGIQSIFNDSLSYMKRNHQYEDFLNAYEKTRLRGKFKICGHIIFGLPNETGEDIIKAAKELARLDLDGIKIHPLHVVKGTVLHDMYLKGEYEPLDQAMYVRLVTDFIEYLSPDTVIQRLTADCHSDYLVAPDWLMDKNRVINEIEDIMDYENKYQGRLFKVL